MILIFNLFFIHILTKHFLMKLLDVHVIPSLKEQSEKELVFNVQGLHLHKTKNVKENLIKNSDMHCNKNIQ